MRKPLSVDEVLAMLEEHPRRLAAATADLQPSRLRRDRVLGDWTATDVLAHLRCCADARGDFIPLILAERRPTPRAIDPRTLLKRVDYRDLDFVTSLRACIRQRARLVKLFKALPRREWSHAAIVTGGGLAPERTVRFYGQWIVRHEQVHVRHIESFAREFTRP